MSSWGVTPAWATWTQTRRRLQEPWLCNSTRRLSPRRSHACFLIRLMRKCEPACTVFFLTWLTSVNEDISLHKCCFTASLPCLIQTMICKWAKPPRNGSMILCNGNPWLDQFHNRYIEKEFFFSFAIQMTPFLFTLSLSTLNYPHCFSFAVYFLSLSTPFPNSFSLCNSCALYISVFYSICLFSTTFSYSVSASWQDVLVPGPAPSASLCGTGWASPKWPAVDSVAALSLVLLPCRYRPAVLLIWLSSHCYISFLQLLSSRSKPFCLQTFPCNHCWLWGGRRSEELSDASVEPSAISSPSSSRNPEVVHSIARICKALQLGRHGPHPQGFAHSGQTHLEVKECEIWVWGHA